ncbi:MAG: DNA-binding domain-containing protein [Bacteriovoracia bacterium]
MLPSEFQKLMSAAILERDASKMKGLSCRAAGTLELQEAVEVYSAGYPARLFEALGETYETIWKVLGDEDFQSLCMAYIEKHPSQYRNLSDYGDDFSDYIRDYFPEDKVRDLLVDLAKFEWTFKEGFHVKFEKSFEFTSLKYINPIELQFQLLSSLSTLSLRFSVHKLHGIEGDADRFLEILSLPSPVSLALIRSQNGVATKEISSPLLEFLQTLTSKSFNLDDLASFCGFNPEKVQCLIREMASLGFLAHVDVGETN